MKQLCKGLSTLNTSMKRKIWYLTWLCIFLVGAVFSLMYVQGLRYEPESQEIVPTGILDLSTHPDNALIFLNDEFQGTTVKVFRGYPLGMEKVRFEKTGFHSFEINIAVKDDFITRIRRFFLIPYDLNIQVIGSDDDIIWDEEKRGLAILLPQQKAVYIIDFLKNEKKVLEISHSPVKAKFLSNGDIEVVLSNGAKVVKRALSSRLFASFERLIAERFLSPDKQQILSFRGNTVFIKNLETEEVYSAFTEEKKIKGAWWMKGSDDILVVSSGEIFFWNKPLLQKRVLLKIDKIDSAVFVPDCECLFYKEGGIWKNTIFGLK